jgi:polysaccharide biosynthesis/export protein
MCKPSRQFGRVDPPRAMVAVVGLVALSLLGSTRASGQTASASGTPGLKLSQHELMREFEEASEGEYTLGAGDELDLQVATNPDLQGHHVIGPDGDITLPIVGSFNVGGLTREGAAKAIAAAFGKYYTDVDVVIKVTKYGSNRVMVVGRVAMPGPISFDTAPTLLEALAKSGAYNKTPGGTAPTLSRCAIYRGADEVLWVDLKQLFASGTSAVDLKLRRGDIVYVPDDADEQVSVLGEVKRPGAVSISPDTRLVDVLAQAGGLTNDAADSKIRLVRPSTGLTREIAFNDLVRPGSAKDKGDIALQAGDVIYVPRSGMAKFGYVLEKVSPMGSLLMFGVLAAGR